jgi:hypothetical protein
MVIAAARPSAHKALSKVVIATLCISLPLLVFISPRRILFPRAAYSQKDAK